MISPLSRAQRLHSLFPDAPAFRRRQAEAAIFSDKAGWGSVTVFPKDMRQLMEEKIPWMSVSLHRLFESKDRETFKAVLRTEDGLLFETVLMGNAREQWTVCVSSQVGCAMRCAFCATGAMGLQRSLTSDEITDQLRFWLAFLRERSLEGRISNIVFMGMGEPLANVSSVKRAIHTWMDQTDLGPTHITVSTVGVLPVMEQLLVDKDWPPVRIAISLHSANQSEREQIVPSTVPHFLDKLADWCRRYRQILGNRRHHLTFEYTLISGVNDSAEQAEQLARFIERCGSPKLNVIPLNPVSGKKFSASQQDRIDQFKAVIARHGIDVMQRRTMGDDIAAACGQLATGEQPHVM
ncbi:MAG: 23S rRNA (adenine(2503)-C(2))-methyltransferase RlmN [Candidatus Peribacteraceae bacterium]|nr:23S rRNA (adenine(2503)-C(2))-methyltransferase RlmN [Candidatus Peribacteraceae bacterium]MDD5742648.1 23S rRNA (adenine(2503)-C(2))-methyltransferase RlmN [Candidatus Peribacteraceae bacterium]